jgi:hypothetical protein
VVTRVARKAARPARIVHQLPGRIRIKVLGAKDDSDYFAAVRGLISGLEGVQSVRVNPTSSSIVVAFNPADPVFHFRLRQNTEVSSWLDLSGEERMFAALDAAVQKGVRYAEQHSRIAELVVSSAEQLDVGLRRASDGYLDLKVLLPLSLAVVSSVHKSRTRGTPMWMTLSVFAFNAFLSLHRHRIDAPALDVFVKRAPDG